MELAVPQVSLTLNGSSLDLRTAPGLCDLTDFSNSHHFITGKLNVNCLQVTWRTIRFHPSTKELEGEYSVTEFIDGELEMLFASLCVKDCLSSWYQPWKWYSSDMITDFHKETKIRSNLSWKKDGNPGRSSAARTHEGGYAAQARQAVRGLP